MLSDSLSLNGQERPNISPQNTSGFRLKKSQCFIYNKKMNIEKNNEGLGSCSLRQQEGDSPFELWESMYSSGLSFTCMLASFYEINILSFHSLRPRV